MESTEHVRVGNSTKLDLATGDRVSASDVDLGIAAMPLTYGDVVALAGDFYGTSTREPISSFQPGQALAAAQDAWGTLEHADQSELARILAILAEEEAAVAKAISNGEQPSTAFHALGDSLSYEWNAATGGAPASEGKLAALRKQGRYLKLALVNMDHFGRDAQKAYMAVHTFALQEALKLHGTDLTSDEGQKALKRAYAICAFGDHFLSDLFAAGHVRTPRRALYEIATTTAEESGLLARVMHGEDNSHGVTVTNGPETWLAYGDGMELDDVNKANWAMAVKAVQASADDVIGAARDGVLAPTHTALQIAPALESFVPEPKPGGPNDAPLFWSDSKDYVYRRGGWQGHWDDTRNYAYTYTWSAAGMAALQVIRDLLPTT